MTELSLLSIRKLWAPIFTIWLLVVTSCKVEGRRSIKINRPPDPESAFQAYGLRMVEKLARGRPSSSSYLNDGRTAVGLRTVTGNYQPVEIFEDPYGLTANSTRDNYFREIVDSPPAYKRSAGLLDIRPTLAASGKLNYLISPISQQIILDELGDLTNSVADSLSEKYNTIWNGASKSSQVKTMGEGINSLECRTIRTSVELTKDDMDKQSGELIRNCRGIVALNRCEGTCSSSVLPSIKSLNGFKKECRCCNESSFRRVQVRLRECYSTLNNRRIVVGSNTNGDGGGQLEAEPNSYMDIEVEEPIDCRCRSCEAYL